MKNLLSKLLFPSNKPSRSMRHFGRRAVSFQISQMAKMGQQLIVATR